MLLKKQLTIINKRSHCESCELSTTIIEQEFTTPNMNLLQTTSRINLPSFDLPNLMLMKCLDEGLAQILVSFNEKLTNFNGGRALVNLGRKLGMRRKFDKANLAIKSLLNE